MQLVVHHVDAVEIHLLGFPVDGSDFVGAFEHDMLEIVSHACGIKRVVLTSGMHINSAVSLR